VIVLHVAYYVMDGDYDVICFQSFNDEGCYDLGGFVQGLMSEHRRCSRTDSVFLCCYE